MTAVCVRVCSSMPQPSSAPLLLDKLSASAAVAYSMRRLSNTYSGDCLTSRRDSDNAELAIGFVADVFDTAAHDAHIGEGSGYAAAWNDQSGNGADLAQSGLTEQPLVEATGARLYFALGDYLAKTSLDLGGGDVTVCAVVERAGAPTTLSIIAVMGASSFTDRGTDYLHLDDAGTGAPRIITDVGNNASSGTEYLSGQHLWTAKNDADGDAWLEIDGTEVARASSAGDSIATGNLYVGRFNTWQADVEIAELIIFPSLLSAADLALLESDVSDYYPEVTI